MKTYLRILRYVKPIGRIIPSYLLLSVFGTLFSVVNFTILIPLLRVLFGGEPPSSVSIPEFSISIDYFKDLFNFYLLDLIQEEGKLHALYYICGIALLSVFLANLFRFLSQLIVARLRIRVIKNLRADVFGKLLKLDLQYFIKSHKGDIVSRVTVDAAEVEQSVVSTLKAVIREPLLIIGYFIALFSLSVELTLYTLIIIPISGAIISLLTKYLKRSAKKSQEALGSMSTFLSELLGAIKIFKAFNASHYAAKKFEGQLVDYSRHTYRMAVKSNLAAPVSEFLGIVVLSIVLLVGGSLIIRQESGLDAAEFIGFLIIFSQVLNPAKAISAAFATISRGLASADRIFELLDTEHTLTETDQAKTIGSFENVIELKDVSYRYEYQMVLKNINLTIQKGTSLAIIGPSGGGKSTLLDLILRFYDPETGVITIDGVPLKQITPESLRNQIGMVSQETILFHDSVANNIAFGYPDVTRENIINAAKSANAHEFISRMTHGYDTMIGERGQMLSGGQAQRISIARAILKNPPILILDEATSSLDAESEREVQTAISALMRDRTSIIVTHRISTIKDADLICVVNRGEITEYGTHRQLLENDGLYKKFTLIQSF